MAKGQREYLPPSANPELSEIGRKLVKAWMEAAGAHIWPNLPRKLGQYYAVGKGTSYTELMAPCNLLHHISLVLLSLSIGVMLPTPLVGSQFAIVPIVIRTAITFFMLSTATWLGGWFLRRTDYARRINEGLSKSNLLERLMLRDQALLEIINSVPLLFRYKYRQYQLQNIKQTAKFIALNLDWFMWPNPRLWRWEWLGSILFLAVLVSLPLLLGSLFSSSSPISTFDSILPVLKVLPYCMVVILMFANSVNWQRRVIHCDALIAHFLERHAGKPDSEAQD